MQTWSRTTMQQVQDNRDGTYVGPPVGKLASPPLSYPDLMMTGRRLFVPVGYGSARSCWRLRSVWLLVPLMVPWSSSTRNKN